MYLQAIHDKIKPIISGIHHEFNDSETITYPYAVYRVKLGSHEDFGQMTGTLEVELYDNFGPNKLPMEQLVLQVQQAFEQGKMIDTDHIVTTQFQYAWSLPSPGSMINRRLVTIRLKIDRRY